MLHDLTQAFQALWHYDYLYPWVLYFLFALIPLALWEFWPRRARQATMPHPRLSVLREAGWSWRMPLLPLPRMLRLAALALLLFALARPQSSEREEKRVEGIDIFLVLDMSGSMQAIDLNLSQVEQLLSDGHSPKDRFVTAVEVLDEFVQSRRERCMAPADDVAARCDRIGMVIFGRDAFLEFPLTLDYGTILTLLEQRALNDIDGSGTAIGNAIARAVAGLRHSNAETKVVIMITDGDRRGGDIAPAQGASMAKHFGIKVFPILVGREGPTLIPTVPDAYLMRRSYHQVEFPVNPQLLEKIASMTDGKFYRSGDKQSLQNDLHDILDHFERSEFEGAVNVSSSEHFRPYAMGGLLLLLLDAALGLLVLRRFP
ncbi:MAG: VWA domain-containing protein [Myxococcota bacterium]|jgi:Ca-activated chloride channel family protein|nr:VWA domain-containing protein [Myxococcota bacterium]